jgi:hypothetical protein
MGGFYRPNITGKFLLARKAQNYSDDFDKQA